MQLEGKQDRSRTWCWRLYSSLLTSYTDQVAWSVCHLHLRTAGDIEENPGPEVLDPCSVCGKRAAGGWLSFRCSVCEQWCHCRHGAVRPATTQSHHRPHPAARSRRIWRIPDRWYHPRLVPSFRRLRGPGGVGSQGLPRFHKARTSQALSATGIDLEGGNILQFNCHGIRHCHAELQDFLHKTPCASRLSARD